MIFITKNSHHELYHESRQSEMPFELLSFLFILQHAIFFVCRPVFFILWTFMTCLCDCGQTDNFRIDDTFDWSLLSPDYIMNQGVDVNRPAAEARNARNNGIVEEIRFQR